MENTSDSIANSVYEKIREMTITYHLKPGERLNEVELSRQLGVSRTPLREALNRLATEGFLKFSSGKGFYCRSLDPKEIFDLYELRKTIEVAGVRLAIQRATKEEVDALQHFLLKTGPEATGRTTQELVQLDEIFHERLLAMSKNAEMLRVLRNVNARIRFVRWLDLNRRTRPMTQKEHRSILTGLSRRDEAYCIASLERHINRPLEHVTATIRHAYAEIYVGSAEKLANPEPA